MKRDEEKDVPVSSDFAKSQEGGGYQLPDFLTSTTGLFIGLGVVVILCAIVYAATHISFARVPENPLATRPGFPALKMHVESLAEVDQLCAKEDRTACLCELSNRITDHRKAIDTLLASDPALKTFSISVRRPASETVAYDFAKLPAAPPEADCLNANSAPTIINDDGPTSGPEPVPADPVPPSEHQSVQ